MPEAMEKLEMKKCLDAAIEWLAEEPTEKANTAAKIFNVKSSSIRMRQLWERHQARNSCSIFNKYAGSNLILTET